jgi:hypothetical protein
MEELLQFVPEDKRDAFSEVAKGYVKFSDDLALEHVLKSQSLRDKVATPVAETALKNFQEKKLPELIKLERDKIMKELNPEETAEQKRIRELEERIAAQDAKEQREMQKAKMRDIGKTKGLDVTLAERLYALPDEDAGFVIDAFEKLAREKTELQTRLQYGSKPPAGGSSGAKSISLGEYNRLSPKEQAAHFAAGGVIQD